MKAATKYLISACLLLCLGVSAYADGCYRGGRSYSYGSSYSYAAPTYSYSYVPPAVTTTYAAPAKPVIYEAPRYLLALPLAELPATYGSVYHPPQQLPPAQQQQSPKGAGQGLPPTAFEEAVLKELKELGRGLREVSERVDRIERTRGGNGNGGYQPQQAPKQQQPPPEQLGPPAVEKGFLDANRDSCAACHARGNLAKGTDFVFSEADGTPVLLTADQREEVQRQLIAGTMPQTNTSRAQSHGVKPLTKEGREAIFRELDRQILASGKRAVVAKK